eukprot:TRINITY_DN2467_c1_g3_i1.p1 TRINITY_DN2467_c1_g3~~TRINITY_DN2467_c1_g3_i1.p1  ORF type:complete len:146 (+),score=15.00 TRINITY_DN2467_c1_g3_i1:322-759(+)
MPCNIGGHWNLVVADLIKREWWIFDSSWKYDSGPDESLIDHWESFMKDHWRHTHGEGSEFPFFSRPQVHLNGQLAPIPQQRKGTHNCGPFVCMFARVLLSTHEKEFDMDHKVKLFLDCENVSLFRKLMVLELVEGKLREVRVIKI